MSGPPSPTANTRLDDLYDERSNRRLVLVVRTLLVCSMISAPTPISGLYSPWPMPSMSAGVIATLSLLTLVYGTVLFAAHQHRWRLARDLLFAGWSLYPATLVLMYHPDADGIVEALVLGLADMFAVLVVVGMVALAPWSQARRWIGAMFVALAVAFLTVGMLWDHPDLRAYSIFATTSLTLLAAAVLPLWAILTDLDGALRMSDAARMEAHALREDAAQARDDALAASQAKSRFLANMSHELRTPLNAILGYAELIGEDAKDHGLAEFDTDLERIHDAGIHLLGLIDSVLDLSKVEAGKTEVSPVSFDPQRVLEEAVETVRPLAASKGLDTVVSIGPLPQMYSDPQKVRQILLNLLSNATKYTDRGSIDVRAATDGDHLVVHVVDTGTGIEADRLQSVFDAFERTDAEVTRRVGGTGLGLAISRRVCGLLGGTLTVASTVGEGSTFTMRVPLRWAATSGGTPLSER